MTPRAIILTGPTGIGKTAAALELARILPARIISADSMQVYRGLDIGTAKPTAEEQAAVRHYGLDLIDPVRVFSVAEWLEAAKPAVEETLAAGEWPIITGGTRLYLHALASPFDAGPPPDYSLRKQIEEDARQSGTAAIHKRLAMVDPEAASRIHPSDMKRIVRALEVHAAGRRPLSHLQEQSRQAAPAVDAVWFGMVRDRAELYDIVEKRTARMIEAGWMAEVEGLVRSGRAPAIDQIRAHGYRELCGVLAGQSSLPAAVEQINRNVRHFVRYQLGWIRGHSGIQVLDAGPGSPGIALEMARRLGYK
ncbi:MAG: tRNA (adenosine(37)-N6)-dimethylallyltransferase MiaA [Chloroflexi bacterium]|nr:tRNA (adenosine(37)-N6)-dimethylallyltransferase MiaA [Chloroflexota bacterium]